VKKVLAEALVVALAGAIVAFAANALSSRGLKLTRNYFPGTIRSSGSTATASSAPSTTPGTNKPSPVQMAVARLKEKGMQVVDDDQAVALFKDPRYEQGAIIFIDARNDEHYKEGHIPGAYQLDHMYPEKYLGTLLPACNVAQQIVVYCNGGDCELSEFAAEMLRSSAGVPNEKLFIYAGGINGWQARGLPMETGERKSGQFRSASK
jgi:rhodanese-related sulfurtransferase